ncbi:D-alanyl-lipoteichoic acid biosynthesis protein DltB, partial [Streptococcus agalactiae]|nr:D-alanyl-lipoteichoic acid biosynthesis protein DltB [Streptococcus agalactiae]
AKKPLLPENKWTYALGVFITFNVVMFSFLIFSGFLDLLWFPQPHNK